MTHFVEVEVVGGSNPLWVTILESEPLRLGTRLLSDVVDLKVGRVSITPLSAIFYEKFLKFRLLLKK